MSQSKAELVAPVGIFTASGVNVTGVVTAASFQGDGSQLQGVGIGTTGSVNSSGIITASAFYGSGIGLTGITLLGPTNSYETTGIITASAFYGDGAGITNINGPLSPITYNPGIGQTSVGLTTNITVTFNKPIIAAGATTGVGTITLRTGSADGAIVESFDIVDSSQLSISGGVLTIDPTSNLSGLTTYFVVIPEGTLKDTIDSSDNVGITTYSFITENAIYDYELYSFGLNGKGQLGLNDIVSRSSPTQIPGTEWTRNIRHGYEGPVLATKSDGTLWAWGHNVYGGLGQNNTVQQLSPTQIPGTQWGTMSVAYHASVATKTDGTLWSWGRANVGGELGQNDLTPRSSPRQIPGTQWVYDDPHKISGGDYLARVGSCAKTDGTMWVWGYNLWGGLGQNDINHRSSPIQLPGTQWNNVYIASSSGGVKTDGTLWVWGYNNYGELGINETVKYSSPVQVPGTQWNYFSVTYGSSIASKTDGTLWSWGHNNVGQLGLNDVVRRSSPTQVPGTQWDLGTYALSTGFYNGYAIKTDGTLWAWGQGIYGALGNNEFANYHSSPVQIPGTQWVAVPQGDARIYAGYAIKQVTP